jgi:hypothetical protein
MKARTDENTYSPHSGLTPALSVMEAAQLNKLSIQPQQQNVVRVQHCRENLHNNECGHNLIRVTHKVSDHLIASPSLIAMTSCHDFTLTSSAANSAVE